MTRFGDLYWGSTVAQMGALLRIEDGANGSPNLCDRLAAHPYDVTRPTAAVDYDALDVDAVLDACDDGAPRSLYHQARALSKAATAPPDEILRLLLPSAREQLPIAYNNISLLMSDAGGTAEEVQELVSTFSELSLITAYPQIAVLLREEQKSAERAETFEWLARKAASLGVPGGLSRHRRTYPRRAHPGAQLHDRPQPLHRGGPHRRGRSDAGEARRLQPVIDEHIEPRGAGGRTGQG